MTSHPAHDFSCEFTFTVFDKNALNYRIRQFTLSYLVMAQSELSGGFESSRFRDFEKDCMERDFLTEPSLIIFTPFTLARNVLSSISYEDTIRLEITKDVGVCFW